MVRLAGDFIDLRRERNFQWRRDEGRILYEPPPIRRHTEHDHRIIGQRKALPIITLSEWQSRVFDDPHRFRVKVCGRRSGKSFEDAIELIGAAIARRDQMVWYVAPTYKSAKEIMWRQLKQLIPRSYLKRKPLETDLVFEFLNDSILQLKGAEDPDSLRGPGLDYLSLDEFAYIDPRAWYEVMRPMISDRMGRATFSTTPAGLNWAYDLFQKGGIDKDWAAFQVTSLEGGRIPDDEIAQAKDELSPRVFRQEYEASFEAVGNRVYEEYDKALNKTLRAEDQPSKDLLVGMDFNVNPMSGVLAVKAADECHVFDAFEIMTSNTSEVGQWLRNRFPNRNIIVCPDPSGKQRRTSAAGKTDFTILKEFNMEIDVQPAAPPVKDRINAVNAMFNSAAGTRRLFIHPRCQKTLGRALDGLTFKPDTNIPNPKGGLVHITDGLGYLIWQQFNLLEDNSFSPVRVRY